MESSVNTSYLCKQLIEINKKYESNSFIDIDFIDLFNISKNTNNLEQLKKKITTKYYNLALKYHPDKYVDSSETIVNVKNCFIKIDEIKSGLFLSFINDIYEMFNNMIKEDPETLINIINGNITDLFSGIDLNSDFNNLKRRLDVNNKEFNVLSSDDRKKIENEMNKLKISEIKINEDQTKELVNVEREKREKLKIENIFTETEQKDPKFKEIFNDVFDMKKEDIPNDNIPTTTDIMPFNFDSNSNLSSNVSIVKNITSSCVASDFNEAFKPIRVNRNIVTQKLSYDEYISQREDQNKLFKNAKQCKQNN